MLRCPGIPLLPGSTFRDLTKTRHHLSHHFEHNNGIPMLSASDHVSGTIDDAKSANDSQNQLPYLCSKGSHPPAWIAYDKKVLCFNAYFKESLHEVYKATHQVRKVKILFYLEDGTMQVSEPRVDNSGISQGCIVSRQRIPKKSHKLEFLTVLDINVDQPIEIFDRVYHITGCDEFTRTFLNRTGIAVVDPIETPVDPGQEQRRKAAENMQSKKPSIFVDTLGQFLEYDRKVLRFYGYWDDRDSMFGDVRDLVIYYFLADDSIQVCEVYPRNSGRDAPTIFLARQRIPKQWNGSQMLGHKTPFTVLNVLGGGFLSGRFVPDCLGVGAKPIEYYSDKDLQIGVRMNLFGREVVLVDLDQFSKDYYRKKYGIEDFTPLPRPFGKHFLSTAIGPAQERNLPVFNGWGTHEDSEGNCKTVEPKPPHIDLNKFIKLDRYLLRFGAKMISKIPENNERSFVITYYLSDDTISVYEMGMRNSGFRGGEFFKRSKCLLPNQEWFTAERPQIYKAHDFYIGCQIVLNDFTFCVQSADEFCLTYMESNPFIFPKSNIRLIMDKVRSALKNGGNYKNFVAKYMTQLKSVSTVNGTSVLMASFDLMRSALYDLLGQSITEHEIITIVRHFSALEKSTECCDRETIRSVVHLEIGRFLWDDIERLKEHLRHLDATGAPHMEATRLRSAILACRIPLKSVLIKNMFSVLRKNANGHIEIEDFLKFIDLKRYKCIPIQPLNLDDICPDLSAPIGTLVKWTDFLEEIGLETSLKQDE